MKPDHGDIVTASLKAGGVFLKGEPTKLTSRVLLTDEKRFDGDAGGWVEEDMMPLSSSLGKGRASLRISSLFERYLCWPPPGETLGTRYAGQRC